MIKLNKIKLTQLSKANLEKREMNSLLGGVCCNCGCGYYGYGGSNTEENYTANFNNGYSETYAPEGVKMCGYNGTCPDVGVT